MRHVLMVLPSIIPSYMWSRRWNLPSFTHCKILKCLSHTFLANFFSSPSRKGQSCTLCHCCRQDNGLLLNPPPEGSFDQRILWTREGIYLIIKSWFLRSKWWYIYIHTYTGRWDPEVAGFLFTYFYSLSSSSHGMIYRSLERHFHVEYNAFEIVGIGSVFMEIFTY